MHSKHCAGRHVTRWLMYMVGYARKRMILEPNKYPDNG